nr:DUF4886 domain-containing protein [Moraxella sp. CTOTU48268]
MANIMTVEQMQNGSLDLQTLSDVMSGAPDTQIRSRLGRMIWTIATINSKVEFVSNLAAQAQVDINAKVAGIYGGYYGAFDTLANLQASAGAKTGQVAKVMNDTVTNNGDYRYTGSAWVKGYDALTEAKNYTDDTVKNSTVLSGSANGTELAIFTDKNGRRTWIEVAADGGLTERTKQFIKDAVLTPVNSANFSYAITDKNGRVLSAIYKDGNAYPKQTSAVVNDKRFKILGIGNSFTQDAFMYVPFLLKEIGITNFEIAVLFYGGCTLEQHWNFASNDSKVYDLEVYKSENEAWQSLGSKTLKEGLNYADFDTITLQQQSARSCDYSTYQPFLNNLVNYIYGNITYPTKLGWHSIPASPEGGWGWNPAITTSAQFYTAQVQAVKNVLRDTPIEYAIPNNTAIQNARGTVLGTLGQAGNMTQDGLHLQDGIPALVAAYAVTLKWLEVFNLRKSIFGSRIAPTDAWLATKGIQGQNGASVGVTTDNILIAQKCAIAAIKNQFETSAIN